MSSNRLAFTQGLCPAQPLLLILIMLSRHLVSASSVKDMLVQATHCASGGKSWTLQLPVWSRLLSNSSEVQVCLNHLEYESTGNLKVSWINGTLKSELPIDSCVTMPAPSYEGRSKTSSPELVLLLELRCPSQWDSQVAKLSLSGSGFVQEVSMTRNKNDSNCELVQTISGFSAENGSPMSLVIALIKSPQPGNLSLQLKTSQSKPVPIDFLTQRSNGIRYTKSGDSELVWVDTAALNEQLAMEFGLDSNSEPMEGEIQIMCGQSTECRCRAKGPKIEVTPLVHPTETPEPIKAWRVICIILAATFAAAALLLTGGKFQARMSLNIILVVSLDRDCDELCRWVRGLRLPGARLLLSLGHQQNERGLYRTLQRDSLTARRTFLLADVRYVLADVGPPDNRSLQIWSMESERFSLMLLCQEEAVSECLMEQLRKRLGPPVTLHGLRRWAIVTSANDCAAFLQQESHNVRELVLHDRCTARTSKP